MQQIGPAKPMHTKSQICKHWKQVARHFEKDCFELKENEERWPTNWKTRVEWNKTEKKIVLVKQQRKAKVIANSIKSINNLAQSNTYSN